MSPVHSHFSAFGGSACLQRPNPECRPHQIDEEVHAGRGFTTGTLASGRLCLAVEPRFRPIGSRYASQSRYTHGVKTSESPRLPKIMALNDMRTRLYLVAEPGPAALARVEAALAAAPVATLLIVPRSGTSLEAAAVKPLVDLAQSKGVAALLSGDAGLARALRTDGVHLPWSTDIMDHFAEARRILGNGCVAGADAGTSRHDAMGLAEAGADYIAFGLPPIAAEVGTASERRFDLVAWWAEIFEIPVVAFDVTELEDAAAFAAAGADFVALALPVDLAPGAVGPWLAPFARTLLHPEAIG